jgi:hypothetical protein
VVDTSGIQVGYLSNVNPATGVYQDPLGAMQVTPPALEWVITNLTTTGLDAPPPIQSGDFPVSNPSEQSSDQDQRDMYILVQQNLPLPCTVVGLYPNYEVHEPR